jgi:hypothetical protein
MLRRDIEGLRAVAVAAVVLYHAGTGLSGGFVGVDVFFVVSGFLITSLLVDERAGTGRFWPHAAPTICSPICPRHRSNTSGRCRSRSSSTSSGRHS